MDALWDDDEERVQIVYQNDQQTPLQGPSDWVTRPAAGKLYLVHF